MEANKTQITNPVRSASPWQDACVGIKESTIGDAMIQPKLSIGSPDDPLEHEADAMADKVMRMPVPEPIHFSSAKQTINRKCSQCEEEEKMMRKEMSSTYFSSTTTLINRKCVHCEEEEEKNLQRKESSSDAVSYAPSIVDDVLSSSSGKSMDESTRSFMESRFNYDFSSVKIHDNNIAAKSADSINALAYTSGNNIVFNSGQYNTISDSGKRLLAHELTHVVQQSNSPASLIQRDDIGRRDAPEFGDIELDANCPTGPTQLGKVEPDPPCKVDTSESNDLKWKQFKFCSGSDIFLNADSPDQLKNFAREHPALATFTVHTYASVEGDKKENENLSCHRARRVVRELINAGAAPEKIQVVGKGVTKKFGPQLQDNRVVVVNADMVDVPALPGIGEETSPQDIVDKAIEFISAGNYRLAADAYISFWTCGQIPTLRDAVRKVEVTVSDKLPPKKKDDEGLGVKKAGMAKEDEEFNQIVLHPDTFDTADPLNCTIARIIDLTFHHMSLPNISDFSDRHRGGISLVELAGYLPCHDPLFPVEAGEPKLVGDPWWPRPDHDLLAGKQPLGCTPSSLPGAQGSDKGHPRLGHKPVLFTLDNSSLKGIPGSINWKVDLSTNTAQIGFDDVFNAKANVTLKGDASEFPNYDVGFIRTILADNTVINYVSGFQLSQDIPAPIRDAEAGSPAPWPKPEFMKTPSEADASLLVAMKDSPNAKKIEFLYAIGNKLPVDPISEDIVDMVQRNVRLGIWVIAKRKDAPLDFADIQFLDGTVINVTQIADIINTSATGTTDVQFELEIPSSGLSRLTGPVPADYHEQTLGKASSTKLGDKRTVSRELAHERTDPEANALSKKEYQAELEKIAGPIRKEMGLTQTLDVNLLLDRKTGRLWVPSRIKGMENILPVQVKPLNEEKEYVPKDVLDRFAERLFAEIRKELVLLEKATFPGAEKLPFEKVNFTLVSPGTQPVHFEHMHKRSGIIEEMRELWRLTEKDDRKNEWSATIAFDRQSNQLIVPFERVQGGKLKKTDSGLEARVDICAKNKLPNIHQTIIGTIHTHPMFDPLEEEGPSKHDKDVASSTEMLGREERFLCGIDHYIVGTEHVLRFNGNGVAEDLGDRKDFLGV